MIQKDEGEIDARNSGPLNQLLGWGRELKFVSKTLDGIGLGWLIRETDDPLKDLIETTGFARTLLILHAIAATKEKADYGKLADTFSRMSFAGTRIENGIVFDKETILNFACSFKETPLSQITERFDDVISWLQQGGPSGGMEGSGLNICPSSESGLVAQEVPFALPVYSPQDHLVKAQVRLVDPSVIGEPAIRLS